MTSLARAARGQSAWAPHRPRIVCPARPRPAPPGHTKARGGARPRASGGSGRSGVPGPALAGPSRSDPPCRERLRQGQHRAVAAVTGACRSTRRFGLEQRKSPRRQQPSLCCRRGGGPPCPVLLSCSDSPLTFFSRVLWSKRCLGWLASCYAGCYLAANNCLVRGKTFAIKMTPVNS